ncbi:MAG: hypothetical protein Greene07144_826 [Parcubacteria group bacterium Greene0714_4]|nr:MAG: hypothetical protein Greene07144_826 [Parcubacteria group bacterium Greene0714_4]
MITTFFRRYLTLAVVVVSLLSFVFIVHAQAGPSNSSISFKKDPSSELFTITIKDSDGIRSFSLEARSKGSYGGDLGKCPNLRIIDNVSFQDPGDFTPVMNVKITDCDGTVDELEVSPPKNGVGKGVRVGGSGETEAQSTAETGRGSGAGREQEIVKDTKSKRQEKGKPEIIYPVSELGGCQNETECRAFCDDADNIKVCVDFAEAHGLMSSEEAKRARKFADTSSSERPGGCSDENECTTYCEDSSHIEECINFAEKHDFMPEDELAQAKKILPLIKSGGTPGGCKTKAQCELYCSEASHIEKCLEFAEENDLIPREELAMAKKMVPLIKRGETPGGCTSKIQCEAYCSQAANMRKCLEFGEKQGIIPPEELAMAKKMLPLMEKGEMPGGCVSKESCEAYCSGEGHAEECIIFAEKAGLMSKEEAAMAKKTGGKGPGGCRSKEQCETYCMENAEACMNWAKENGLEGELGGLPGGAATFSGPGGCKSEEECTAYCTTNYEDEACKKMMQDFGGAPGNGASGGDFPGGGGTGGQFPGGGATGGDFPGGCKNQEECVVYCTKNYTDPACASYIDGGPHSGPGGCSSLAECEAYCRTHPQECGGERPPPPPPPPPSAQNCTSPPSGLISWWNGDSASDLVDGNTGSLSGSISMTDGKIGRAYKLDGGFMQVGNPPNLNFGTGPFSLEAWFNWDGGGSSKGNIIRKSNYPVSGDGAGYWLVVGKEKSIVEFFVGETVGNPGTSRGSVSASIRPGIWHYVVATRNTSGTMSLYIDGQLQGTAEAPGAHTTSEAPFTLGVWDDRFGLTELFSGLIDEVSVYNRALNASEVKNIYSAKAGKCTTQLLQGNALDVECTKRGGTWDGKTCHAGGGQIPQSSPSPSSSGGVVPSSGQIPQEYCSSFASVPSCSYVGAPDSQNYKYCKQCYPER